MVAMATLAVVGLAAILLVAGRASYERSQVDGATDLAAVAGGHAQLAGLPACDAARRTAEANGVELVDCRVRGDDVEFVVSVSVRREVRWGPLDESVEAHAHAGVVTGAPDEGE